MNLNPPDRPMPRIGGGGKTETIASGTSAAHLARSVAAISVP
jgi:hypothetical protein